MKNSLSNFEEKRDEKRLRSILTMTQSWNCTRNKRFSYKMDLQTIFPMFLKLLNIISGTPWKHLEVKEDNKSEPSQRLNRSHYCIFLYSTMTSFKPLRGSTKVFWLSASIVSSYLKNVLGPMLKGLRKSKSIEKSWIFPKELVR